MSGKAPEIGAGVGNGPQPNRPPPIGVAAGAGAGTSSPVNVAGATPVAASPVSSGGVAGSGANTPTVPPRSISSTRKTVFVASGLLSGHVISAPKPAYPVGARFQQVQGDVVLQAMISEYGAIEDVKVISGPDALKQAAVDAFKRWRYKPYLVNGQPVEVRTFVNFHFTMP
jgi:protein TonB